MAATAQQTSRGLVAEWSPCLAPGQQVSSLPGLALCVALTQGTPQVWFQRTPVQRVSQRSELPSFCPWPALPRGTNCPTWECSQVRGPRV